MNKNNVTIKFFTGLFILLPILLFPSQKILGLILYPSTPLGTFLTEGNLTLLLLTLIICLLLYYKWRSIKIVISSVVGSIIVASIFGIAFVFTFLMWVGLSVILLIYTLLKRETILATYKNPTPNTPKLSYPRNIIFLLIFGFVGYFLYFGGLFPCTYSYTQMGEVGLPLDKSEKIKLTFKNDQYLVKGGQFNNYNCPWSSGPNFKNNIIEKDTLDSCVNCKSKLIKDGATISTLPEGTIMYFKNNYLGGKRGITSGGTPRKNYWLLKDINGIEYTLLAPDYKNGSREKMFKEFERDNSLGFSVYK